MGVTDDNLQLSCLLTAKAELYPTRQLRILGVERLLGRSDMYYLPWWMQWGQALGLIAISGLGAWIAFKQVKIATAKLNLDLYDRRFKVFEGARNLVAGILQEGQIATSAITLFSVRVADATFLFDADVEKYLDALRKKAILLHMKGEQLRGMEEPGERRNAIVDQVADLEMDFSVEYEKMIEVFKPYLKLGNI